MGSGGAEEGDEVRTTLEDPGGEGGKPAAKNWRKKNHYGLGKWNDLQIASVLFIYRPADRGKSSRRCPEWDCRVENWFSAPTRLSRRDKSPSQPRPRPTNGPKNGRVFSDGGGPNIGWSGTHTRVRTRSHKCIEISTSLFRWKEEENFFSRKPFFLFYSFIPRRQFFFFLLFFFSQSESIFFSHCVWQRVERKEKELLFFLILLRSCILDGRNHARHELTGDFNARRRERKRNLFSGPRMWNLDSENEIIN